MKNTSKSINFYHCPGSCSEGIHLMGDLTRSMVKGKRLDAYILRSEMIERIKTIDKKHDNKEAKLIINEILDILGCN